MKIVLLPGFPDFTNLGVNFFPDEYFKGVPGMLRERGFEVFTPKVGPFGTPETRSGLLATDLADAGVFNDPGKAHIIAHSAGGLDARYLVSPDAPNGARLASRIRSITTISTPHRGTPIADVFSGALTGVENIVPALQAKFPNLAEGVRGLTTREMSQFNNHVHDAEEVEYFSYAGVLGAARILEGSVFGVTQPLFVLDGVKSGWVANDGWVSVGSAQWREFKGTVPADHAEEIGYDLSPLGIFPFGARTFPHLELYARIAADIISLGE